MLTRTKIISMLLLPLFGILIQSNKSIFAANSVTLYTPYTKVSVPPGEAIDYALEVINGTSEVQNVELSLIGLPKGWNYILKSEAWNIEQISILPGDRKKLSLKVEVPLKVNKGTYRFKLIAKGLYTLPLTVIVTEKGTYKTELTTKQSNMQGQAKSAFTFNVDLKNRTAEKQLYALISDAPRGWNVLFKANYKQVTSVETDANSSTGLTVEVHPPELIPAGTYKIPVRAMTSETSADLELEVVITGSYDMELTTPTGLLSAKVTAGKTKRIELVVTNTGSSKLTDIGFSFNAPPNWEIVFDPKKIDELEPGRSETASATIKADKKAVTGDYALNITAKTPETSSKEAFRISVETPMLWGWIGVLIILLAIGSVIYLFRKYGRR